MKSSGLFSTMMLNILFSYLNLLTCLCYRMAGQCLCDVKQEIQISCASSGFKVDIYFGFYFCSYYSVNYFVILAD